jgi:hypothetical protein
MGNNQLRTYGEDRHCTKCGKKLSIYNPHDICFCHQPDLGESSVLVFGQDPSWGNQYSSGARAAAHVEMVYQGTEITPRGFKLP